MHPVASSCLLLFFVFQVFPIIKVPNKSRKNYIKNQRSGSFRESKGGPQGSQGAARRVPGAAQPLPAPPALLAGSHTPRCPTLAPIYSPDAETPEKKSLFQSTSRSRHNPQFFSGRANLEAALASGEGKSSPSSSPSPLHHPSMTSSLMCE